eukprot:CAMPEP_0202888698 /NCGR_PEP_ID=MMETSP1391-20130828/43326_1 /ASSEMBLY_ACC=CAM_ASM_000867 /TAXON_ID=1034604 /ORGANISM="Chlamydomonas leiostraca, Strain SAG 11-49" /LENGTH=238 /DNA_ID=CAMNT_0049572009 /DNA_START=64 /DNA_END=780 /DNA_ORIENTATION=-
MALIPRATTGAAQGTTNSHELMAAADNHGAVAARPSHASMGLAYGGSKLPPMSDLMAMPFDDLWNQCTAHAPDLSQVQAHMQHMQHMTQHMRPIMDRARQALEYNNSHHQHKGREGGYSRHDQHHGAGSSSARYDAPQLPAPGAHDDDDARSVASARSSRSHRAAPAASALPATGAYQDAGASSYLTDGTAYSHHPRAVHEGGMDAGVAGSAAPRAPSVYAAGSRAATPRLATPHHLA